MPDKPNILFVGNYNRKDYLDMFLKSKGHFNFFFLEFASPKEITNEYYTEYGKAVFWGEYHNAFDLLESVNPSKVVFLFIEAYNHVALNIACKISNIPTFHLEHGLRADYLLNASLDKKSSDRASLQKKLKRLFNLLVDFKARYKSRIFLTNSIKHLPADDADFMKNFIQIRRTHTFLQSAFLIRSPRRMADYYISFSKNIFNVHRAYDNLPQQQKVFYIGIPYFDKITTLSTLRPRKEILFIDQPLVEHKLLEWTLSKKRKSVNRLIKICAENNLKLYIKPHPSQNLKEYQLTNSAVELIDEKKLLAIAPQISLVLGFYSTLLMPFAALPHISIITLENHPAGKLDVSKSFVKAGVAHAIYDLDELPPLLQNVEQLHQKQLPYKTKFTEDWMYKFDGKAGERLRDILLSDEL